MDNLWIIYGLWFIYDLYMVNMLSFAGQGFKGLEKNDLGNKGFGLGNKASWAFR